MQHNRIASEEEWLAARKQHSLKEKEYTRLRGELSRQRRELPWVKVNKPYVFDGPDGRETLSGLFAERSQLILYHFTFGPGWQEGCPSCTFLVDHVDGALVHLNARDVTLAVVSRAPLPQIQAFKKRMGWRFKWVSSYYGMEELGVEELPGTSVFYKDPGGDIYHTYSSYARGGDVLMGTYNFLDLTPQGRDEDGLVFTMAWVRHHTGYDDAYDDNYAVNVKAPYLPPELSVYSHCSEGNHS